jgi:hypothetical protein
MVVNIIVTGINPTKLADDIFRIIGIDIVRADYSRGYDEP